MVNAGQLWSSIISCLCVENIFLRIVKEPEGENFVPIAVQAAASVVEIISSLKSLCLKYIFKISKVYFWNYIAVLPKQP